MKLTLASSDIISDSSWSWSSSSSSLSSSSSFCFSSLYTCFVSTLSFWFSSFSFWLSKQTSSSLSFSFSTSFLSFSFFSSFSSCSVPSLPSTSPPEECNCQIFNWRKKDNLMILIYFIKKKLICMQTKWYIIWFTKSRINILAKHNIIISYFSLNF